MSEKLSAYEILENWNFTEDEISDCLSTNEEVEFIRQKLALMGFKTSEQQQVWFKTVEHTQRQLKPFVMMGESREFFSQIM